MVLQMITYQTGNLLDARVDALVNTVNEVGVMGKGIALQFRDSYPESAREYMDAAKRGDVRVGKVLATPSHMLVGPRWIIHFPTKRHWRQPSRLEWVRDGLKDLVRVVQEMDIRSIAVPPLGCGNGGLDWTEVSALIDGAFAAVADVDVVVFEPTDAYQAAAKAGGVKTLTPARALIAEMVRRYSALGLGCTNLEVHKLAWFLQRVLLEGATENPLRLRFVADRYGPYADQLRHLLDALDGSYLHSEKRLSEAGPFEPIRFEDAQRGSLTLYLAGPGAEFLPALEATTALIDGFESPLGMELLATVDWLLTEEDCGPTTAAVKAGLAAWPGGAEAGRRKLDLFDDWLIELALARLAEPRDAWRQNGQAARLC